MKAATFRYPPSLRWLCVELPWDPEHGPELVEAFKQLVPGHSRTWVKGIPHAMAGHWEVDLKYRDQVRAFLRERGIPIRGDDPPPARTSAAELEVELLGILRLLRCVQEDADLAERRAKTAAAYREACEREAARGAAA